MTDVLWRTGIVILGIFMLIGIADAGMLAGLGAASLSLVAALGAVPLWGWAVIVLLLVVLERQR